MKVVPKFIALGLLCTTLASSPINVLAAEEPAEVTVQETIEESGEVAAASSEYVDAILESAEEARKILFEQYGGWPLSTLSASPEYFFAVHAQIILTDLTDDAVYDLRDYMNGFPVYIGHSYSLTIQMNSNGAPIQDVGLTFVKPERRENYNLTAFWINAYNTTKRPILFTNFFLRNESHSPILELPIESYEMFESEVYLGDISDTPTEISIFFHAW